MDLATRKMVYYGLVGLLLAGSAVALFQASPMQILPKDGTLSIYLSSIQYDIPGNPNIATNTFQAPLAHVSGLPTLLSLNVTIDSVTIHKNGDTNDNGMVVSNMKFTFDVLKSFNVSNLISNAKVPVEDVTMVSLHVASATAAVQGKGLQTVRVPSAELKIPVSPAVHVSAQKSSSIVISGTAHIVFEGSGDIMLTPVLHVEKTTGPQ
jgi:Domain of unknown function (DUF4382)